MDARWGTESDRMKKLYLLVAVFITLQCNDDTGLTAVWDYGCESAIRSLRNEQQEVESAHNDFESAQSEMESARSMYNFCSPGLYDDCEFQRMTTNTAIQQYNYALDTLRTQIRDFEYVVGKFKRECLQ